MATNDTLAARIKAEFDAQTQRAKAEEQTRSKQREDREQRLAKFNALCEELKAIWRPRLEEFARQFGDQVKVTPTVSPALREAKVDFLTDLASVTMTFSVSPSVDVTKLVLDYDLLIIPMLFEYQRHARLELPVDNVDRAALGKWIDDQLVACVKAYLTLSENEFYLRRAMVDDPITKKQFLKHDAKATLEHAGKTYYFDSQESLALFKAKQQIGATPPAKP